VSGMETSVVGQEMAAGGNGAYSDTLEMDATDRELLNLLQDGLPLCERPFLALAEQLGISEREAVDRAQAMRQAGVIRRFGGVFNSRSLGFSTTLCAAAVPLANVDEAADIISSYDCVTHNYLRSNAYNLWFTVIAASAAALEGTIREMEQRIGVSIYTLPSAQLFKVDARFAL